MRHQPAQHGPVAGTHTFQSCASHASQQQPSCQSARHAGTAPPPPPSYMPAAQTAEQGPLRYIML